jgi:hypothetical protein
VAVGLDGQHQAGAHGLAVEQDGAGTAHAVLAADVGAGEIEVVAEEVGRRRGSTWRSKLLPLTETETWC